MTVEFVQEGRAVDYTPAGDVSAGDVVVQGELLGVAVKDIQADQLGALAVEGVFDFPKDTSTAFDAGVDVYWDAANGEATEDPAGGANRYIGKTVESAAAADETLRAKLVPPGRGDTGGVQTIRQSVALADFTDNGDATGSVDLDEQVPVGALVLGVELEVTTAFDSTSPTAQVGESGNLDRFTADSALVVDSVGKVGSEAPDAAGGAYVGAAVTPRVTVTDGAGTPDFGNITTGALTVAIAYLELSK